jgi:multidrug efflux system membrane fusion protein
MRPIVVQKQDETRTVVKSGIEANERVVTTGFVRLTDNSKVSVGTGQASPATGQGPQLQGGAQRPDGQNGQRRQRGGNSPRSNPQQ